MDETEVFVWVAGERDPHSSTISRSRVAAVLTPSGTWRAYVYGVMVWLTALEPSEEVAPLNLPSRVGNYGLFYLGDPTLLPDCEETYLRFVERATTGQ